jgi:hypothetical protein
MLHRINIIIIIVTIIIILICYHIYTGYVQLYDWNKPCLYGI